MLLEYYALGHHCVPRCNKSLLVMIMNYQEDYFERNKWELETRQTVQVRCVILDME